MQRLIIYLKRRADLPQQPFFDWWLGPHRVLVEQWSGLRHYIISLAVEEQNGPSDGLAEVWFDNLATVQRVTPARWSKRRSGIPWPTPATASASRERAYGLRV